MSNGGRGRTPAWSPNGKQLFYHDYWPNRLLAVDVRAEQQGLAFSAPAPLPIDGTIHPYQQRNYDVTPDGRRLLVVLPEEATKTGAARNAPTQTNVVLNWFEELRKRAPAK